MGIFDRSGLPPHLNDQEEIDKAFPDDSQFGGWFGRLYKWWSKTTKSWEAFSWRSPKGIAFAYILFPGFYLLPFLVWFTGWSWWYLFPIGVIPVARQWRKVPKILFAIKGDGVWRFEADGKPDLWSHLDDPKEYLKEHPDYYLSRMQLWSDWHIAIQWPIFFSYHIYDIPDTAIKPGKKENRDGEITTAYAGAKRDTDCFWFVSFFAGENFK